ncbi:hypothetical protein ALC57_04370 [Trachymyrmex cornetzi]|uniref:PDZ domain-containing protein n=1 Tax=Trachymyrmex cornetzi TaxID=471704 RepID=A0A151JCP8_9HYME|nr:hypothetical protein ALC57_04370 [Trachymyrmex cornetzi]
MAEEELLVTLCRGDSGSGGSFGFSLLGASASAGLPAAHVIYDIVENSPAARSGKPRRAVRTIFACLFHRKLILTYSQRFSHDRFLCICHDMFLQTKQ